MWSKLQKKRPQYDQSEKLKNQESSDGMNSPLSASIREVVAKS
ncbi:MAG: hypothetical protein ACI915_000967, partial [Gammaproteobacteria bacterium]